MKQPIVYLDGEYLPEQEARVSLLTHALNYGTGVFEGIRAYHDAETGTISLFRARDHFDRMIQNVRFLKIDPALGSEEMLKIADELIRLNALTSDQYIRPLAFKSATKVGVTLPPEDSFAMAVVPMGDYLDTHKGLRCCVSSWRRLQDNSIPCRAKICGAYVNSALAAQEARDRGFDEAIFLNEAGHVAEGSAMNIFLVRKGRLVTPDLSQGILEGITRDSVITLAGEIGVSTEARTVDRTELYVADEIFLCGTAAQIAPVTSVDERPVGDGRPGPLTLSLQKAYDRAVRGKLPGHEDWVHAVPILSGVPAGSAR